MLIRGVGLVRVPVTNEPSVLISSACLPITPGQTKTGCLLMP